MLYARHLAHKPAFLRLQGGFANCCGSCLHGRYAASKSRLDAGLIDISYDSKSPGMEKSGL